MWSTGVGGMNWIFHANEGALLSLETMTESQNHMLQLPLLCCAGTPVTAPTTGKPSRVHLEKAEGQSRRDSGLVTKSPWQKHSKLNQLESSINKCLLVKKLSFLSWKKGSVWLNIASIELIFFLIFNSKFGYSSGFEFFHSQLTNTFYVTTHYIYIQAYLHNWNKLQKIALDP